MAKDNNNDVLMGLLSISEEITNLNWKLKQMVESLHSNDTGLATAKELSTTLTDRVKQLTVAMNQYKPIKAETTKQGTPSNADGVNERMRIVPTPDNFMEFTDDSIFANPIAKVKPKPRPKPKNIVKENHKVTAPITNDGKLLQQPTPSSATKIEESGIVSETKDILEDDVMRKKNKASKPKNMDGITQRLDNNKKRNEKKKRQAAPKKPSPAAKERKRQLSKPKKRGGFFGKKS